MSQRWRIRLIGVWLTLVGVFIWLNLPITHKPVTKTFSTPKVSLEVTSTNVIFYFTNDQDEALPVGVPIRLLLTTPAGPLIKHVQTTGKLLHIDFPYARAGKTPYKLTVGNKIFEGSFIKEPGSPITPLDLNVGARATRITSSKDPALVLHPLDAQKMLLTYLPKYRRVIQVVQHGIKL